MQRIAIIENGVVKNVALWEDKQEWKQDMESKGSQLVDVTNQIEVGPDYLYSNGTFTPPPYTPKEEDETVDVI